MAQPVLGIDLGGTKVLAGVVDVETGAVLSSVERKTQAELGVGDIVSHLLEAAESAIDQSRIERSTIAAVGIGAAGQIDRERGIILNSPNLTGMTNVPLVDTVRGRLDMPVWLFNDVQAAAAGEATFGAGKDTGDLIVVFVGTGIGGGIYYNGKPYNGATGTAGEIGHTVVQVNGRICRCGGIGHLEAYASHTALTRVLLTQIHGGRETVLTLPDTYPDDPRAGSISYDTIAQALKAGDELTRESVQMAATFLAAGLASLINLYNPSLVVLGGGMVETMDELYQTAIREGVQGALQVPRRAVEIVKASLGADSGVVGAALLALQRTQDR